MLSFFASCSVDNIKNVFSNKEKYVKKFTCSSEVKGQRINVNMLGVSDIYINDTLIIFTLKNTDKLYRIVSLNTYTVVADIVNTGKAKNELLASLNPQYFVKENNEIKMIVYDYYDNVLKEIPLTHFLNSEMSDILPSDFIEQSIIPSGVYCIHQIPNGAYFIDYLDMKDVTQKYAVCKDGAKLQDIGVSIDGVKTTIDQCYLLAGATTFNMERKLYACAMKFFNQINIIDIERPDKSFSITTREHPDDLNKILADGYMSAWYYTDLASNSESIIGLFVNGDKSELHIFDWKGNPLYNLKLDLAIERIDIDNNNNVYGITDEEEIYMYDISNFLATTK